MKTKFESINVSREEYNFFKTLSSQERLDYIFSLYASAAVGLDLSNFFTAIHAALDNPEAAVKSKPAEQVDTVATPSQWDRVDVMIDDEIIMIEANSLRAMRHVINRFMESGYILQRDIEQEKMFRKDKMTRYMRVFYIVDQINGICFN
jgi:hypothetical protein